MAKRKKKTRSSRSRAGESPSEKKDARIRELKNELAMTGRGLRFLEKALYCAPSERQLDEDRVRATGLAIRKASELQRAQPPGVDTGFINAIQLPCDVKALVFGWGRGFGSASGNGAERAAMNAAISDAQDKARTKVQAAIDAVRCPGPECPSVSRGQSDS